MALSTHQIQHLQAAVAAREAIRGAVGWLPRDTCPLPIWQDPPRELSFHTTRKQEQMHLLTYVCNIMGSTTLAHACLIKVSSCVMVIPMWKTL